MSSTNKTTNYELSQYIGSDKPTYLSDYNGDMYKIDAQMKVNADNVATAISTANTATTTANSANSTATTANTTANSASATATQANTTATNAQTTANSALSTATTAQTTANTANSKADAIAQKLNLTNLSTIAGSSMSKTGGGNNPSGTIYTAINDDGSIAKVYGQVDIGSNGNAGNIIIPTNLRPKDSQGTATDLTIVGHVLRTIGEGSSIKNFGTVNMIIRSNGNIEIPYTYINSGGDGDRFVFGTAILFLTPFNDEPIPDND